MVRIFGDSLIGSGSGKDELMATGGVTRGVPVIGIGGLLTLTGVTELEGSERPTSKGLAMASTIGLTSGEDGVMRRVFVATEMEEGLGVEDRG